MSTLGRMKRVVTAVQEAARKDRLPVTVCVLDQNGAVIVKERMDGAFPLSVEMAEVKAYTSAMLAVATIDLVDLVQPGAPLYGLTSFQGGRFVAIGGGVPLREAEIVVGALGVSGGTIEDDTRLAGVGLEAFSVAESRGAPVT